MYHVPEGEGMCINTHLLDDETPPDLAILEQEWQRRAG